jgi:hypothetical protein
LYFVEHPLAGRILVLVMTDLNPLGPLVSSLQAAAPLDILLMCLRKTETSGCSIPDRFAMHLSDLHWYLCTTVPIYGKPCVNTDKIVQLRESTLFVIEHILHYTRCHLILTLLSSHQYRKLAWRLESQIVQLLRALSIWQRCCLIEGQSLTPDHVRKIDDIQLRGALTEWLDLKQTLMLHNFASRGAAFRAVWLFESVVRYIREITIAERQVFNE